jgi:hypothetical protein
MAEDEISASWRVTSNVTKSPDSLFTDVIVRRGQKILEDWYCATVNDNTSLFRGTRGNISQGPSSFELKIVSTKIDSRNTSKKKRVMNEIPEW